MIAEFSELQIFKGGGGGAIGKRDRRKAEFKRKKEKLGKGG